MAWQQAKHTRLCSDVFQVLKRECFDSSRGFCRAGRWRKRNREQGFGGREERERGEEREREGRRERTVNSECL